MLELKSFTITILICASVRLSEQGLVMRPTRAFSDVLNMGRREHLMTKSNGNINSVAPRLPGQVPRLLQQRRPLVGRPKIEIGQHLPRLPPGYTPSRYRLQQQRQRPYQPRGIFRQNNPDFTTSTSGPILRQKPANTTDVTDTTTDTTTIAAPTNETSTSDDINEPDSQNSPNNLNLPREPENYISKLYEGPSTRSTSPLYAPGQEPQHGYTDKVLQQKCKNAQCNPVAWQDVEEIT